MNIAACDSSTHSTAEHAGDSMAAAHTHVVHLASQLIESSCKGDMSRPDAAPAPAAADAAHDNQEAAGADPQKAAAADGDDAPGDDKQEAAAVEADGAAVAAWLIQQPSLLQDVLGHLESLAMSAVDGSSIQTPASDPPALLGASSTARDEPSAACACATQLHFLLPDVSVIGMQAAGQPVPSSSASASRQECGQQAAATPLPSHADEHFVTPVVCVPQSEALSPHKTSADVAVQQSGTASLQVSHSNTGVCGGERQEAACARQQQHAACSDFHSDPGECQGSCHGASWPAPVPPTSRALLEHCTAGR